MRFCSGCDKLISGSHFKILSYYESCDGGRGIDPQREPWNQPDASVTPPPTLSCAQTAYQPGTERLQPGSRHRFLCEICGFSRCKDMQPIDVFLHVQSPSGLDAVAFALNTPIERPTLRGGSIQGAESVLDKCTCLLPGASMPKTETVYEDDLRSPGNSSHANCGKGKGDCGHHDDWRVFAQQDRSRRGARTRDSGERDSVLAGVDAVSVSASFPRSVGNTSSEPPNMFTSDIPNSGAPLPPPLPQASRCNGGRVHKAPLSMLSCKLEHVVDQESPYGFICDWCERSIARNACRFRCADCLDYDLCASCFSHYRPTEHCTRHAFYVCRGNLILPPRNILFAPVITREAAMATHLEEEKRAREVRVKKNDKHDTAQEKMNKHHIYASPPLPRTNLATHVALGEISALAAVARSLHLEFEPDGDCCKDIHEVISKKEEKKRVHPHNYAAYAASVLYDIAHPAPAIRSCYPSPAPALSPSSSSSPSPSPSPAPAPSSSSSCVVDENGTLRARNGVRLVPYWLEIVDLATLYHEAPHLAVQLSLLENRCFGSAAWSFSMLLSQHCPERNLFVDCLLVGEGPLAYWAGVQTREDEQRIIDEYTTAREGVFNGSRTFHDSGGCNAGGKVQSRRSDHGQGVNEGCVAAYISYSFRNVTENPPIYDFIFSPLPPSGTLGGQGSYTCAPDDADRLSECQSQSPMHTKRDLTPPITLRKWNPFSFLTPRIPETCVVLHIDSLAVDPRRQGCGLGALMLQHALIQGDTRPDCVGVTLHVDVTNVRAMHMYLQHGFTVVETISNYYNNGHDAFLMIRGV